MYDMYRYSGNGWMTAIQVIRYSDLKEDNCNFLRFDHLFGTIMLTTQDKHYLCCQRVARALG